MPVQYERDGDEAFIALNSRDNPASLPKGTVSKSRNFRLDRGVASMRKGLQRKTSYAIIDRVIYGVGVVLDITGQEIFIIAVEDGLYTYNPETELYSSQYNFPEGEIIEESDVTPPYSNSTCDIIVAVNKIYITRGHNKRPLVANINLTTYEISSVDVLTTDETIDGYQFPNCNGLMYYANRLIAMGKHYTDGYEFSTKCRDTICVSNFLDFNHWDNLDVFNINEGGNDETIALAPWSLTEFVIFMRNSIYYVNVGYGRYSYSEPLNSGAGMRLLVSDLGCIAKRTIIQANGGIMFLANNGVYALNPTQVGANDATRLLANSSPISAPVDDIIQRINKKAVYRSVATYYNNRYYLAVPIDESLDNNYILIYNFILNAWESVDTFPAGFDILAFAVGKKDNQRRLFGFDKEKGVFLFEELEYDEYGDETGKPILSFTLPVELGETSFTPNTINAELDTRLYTFNTLRDKRFSTAEVDISCDPASRIDTYMETINPDTTTLVDSFGSPAQEDYTRRLAVRKIAYGCKYKFITNNLRTDIKSTSLTATLMGKQNISRK